MCGEAHESTESKAIWERLPALVRGPEAFQKLFGFRVKLLGGARHFHSLYGHASKSHKIEKMGRWKNLARYERTSRRPAAEKNPGHIENPQAVTQKKPWKNKLFSKKIHSYFLHICGQL